MFMVKWAGINKTLDNWRGISYSCSNVHHRKKRQLLQYLDAVGWRILCFQMWGPGVLIKVDLRISWEGDPPFLRRRIIKRLGVLTIRSQSSYWIPCVSRVLTLVQWAMCVCGPDVDYPDGRSSGNQRWVNQPDVDKTRSQQLRWLICGAAVKQSDIPYNNQMAALYFVALRNTLYFLLKVFPNLPKILIILSLAKAIVRCGGKYRSPIARHPILTLARMPPADIS